ncbi:MAG: hypothetical protein WC890_06550 [Candidatus Margulisiibacteriota bacterium]
MRLNVKDLLTAYSRQLTAVCLVLIAFCLTSPAYAEYGPEYFSAIEGEVSGQAAPGVQSVLVNGKAVKIKSNYSFSANVSLAEGQKYLIIETHYKNIGFIKKFLVVRQPGMAKSFKIVVPKSDFKKLAAPKKYKATIKRIKKILRKKKLPITRKKIIKKQKYDGSDFQFVIELEKNTFFAVRKVKNKYFALIYLKDTYNWIPLYQISRREFRDLLRENKLPADWAK